MLLAALGPLGDTAARDLGTLGPRIYGVVKDGDFAYFMIWVWINTYENTIFSGMNIHKSQLFWGSPGVQGFDPSPYEWSISPISIQKWMVHHGTSSIIG